MWRRVARLVVIKTRFEAYMIIYALAVGATARAQIYLHQYPGHAGYLLAFCCTGAVFLGGAKILDALRYEREAQAMERQNADID